MVNLNHYNLLEDCRNQISKLNSTKILLAYSGGIDSSVLLDCLYKISLDTPLSIRTIHVNHGLSPQSIEFEKHCLEITSRLNIEHETIKINIDSSSNIEELSRKKRYLVLTNSCRDDEVIFTAHHDEDQIETFLQRLIRGSGARGLSSMKKESKYFNKLIYRPFLNISKSIIDKYCNMNNISYIQDQSNHDDRFDRNFIRNNVVPVLRSRWPSISKNILNNIEVQEINIKCLTDYARSILPNLYLSTQNELSVSKLNQELTHNKILIIHEWVIMQTGIILNLKQIKEILKILNTNNDSNPLFTFDQIKIIKNKDILRLSIIDS
tara:strand:+ start:294 stop:1262 length:969 start_codon:yes stop_codon:yes gene_type:complete